MDTRDKTIQEISKVVSFTTGGLSELSTFRFTRFYATAEGKKNSTLTT